MKLKIKIKKKIKLKKYIYNKNYFKKSYDLYFLHIRVIWVKLYNGNNDREVLI